MKVKILIIDLQIREPKTKFYFEKYYIGYKFIILSHNFHINFTVRGEQLQISLMDTFTVRVLFNYQRIRLAFPENKPSKNGFLAVCAAIDDKADLLSINSDCSFGGHIGMGDSFFDGVLNWSKLMRVHAVYHDAYGYMARVYNKGPGYDYVSLKTLKSWIWWSDGGDNIGKCDPAEQECGCLGKCCVVGHCFGIIFWTLFKHRDRTIYEKIPF